jgi:hypothetical protein
MVYKGEGGFMTSDDFKGVCEAAEKGDRDAMYYLGLMYLRGDGVEKNEGTGGMWLLKAAEKGQEDAVGLLKETGTVSRARLLVSGIGFFLLIVLNLIFKKGSRIMAGINAGLINACLDGFWDHLEHFVITIDIAKSWFLTKITGSFRLIFGIVSFIFWITITIRSCGGKQIENKLYLFLMNPDDYVKSALFGVFNPAGESLKITVTVPVPTSAIVTANAINFRSGPGVNSAVLKTLRKGDALIVTGKVKNGWLPVEHLGTAGYVSGELVSIKPGGVGNAQKADFKITKLVAGNSDGDGEWITQAGEALNAGDVKFLKPVITYNASTGGEVTFYVKIIDPTGKLKRNKESSPEGYSYATTRTIESGAGTPLALSGWGSENGGSYQAGLYTIEVWCDGLCLRSEKIRMN